MYFISKGTVEVIINDQVMVTLGIMTRNFHEIY